MLARLIGFVLTATVILAAPCLLWCDPLGANMPKDAELIELFRSHHDAFERQAAMETEDAGTISHLSIETLDKEPLADGQQNLPVIATR
jgi:hypothetical protein